MGMEAESGVTREEMVEGSLPAAGVGRRDSSWTEWVPVAILRGTCGWPEELGVKQAPLGPTGWGQGCRAAGTTQSRWVGALLSHLGVPGH